jgi:hypothetical protein
MAMVYPQKTQSFPIIVHPVCRPAQTAAVADSVQTAMDEMIRKRRAARSGRV